MEFDRDLAEPDKLRPGSSTGLHRVAILTQRTEQPPGRLEAGAAPSGLVGCRAGSSGVTSPTTSPLELQRTRVVPARALGWRRGLRERLGGEPWASH